MNKWPHIAGIAFSAIFGFSFMFSKILLDTISPMGVIAYRFLAAFVVFELLRQLKIVKINIRKETLVPILIVAILQPVFYFIFETYGLNLTTSAEAGLMIALIPIFVIIFGSIFLKERPRKIQILFIIVSFIGVLIIQIFKPDANFEVNMVGFVLLLLAVISAALFNIASRHASKTSKPHEITYFMMFVGMVSFNLIYITQLLMKNEVTLYFTYLTDIQVILPILYLGIIASIGGFFLVNFALSRLPAHVSAVYANISTIIAVLAGYIFLDEPIGIYHVIGGLLIIIGVYGTAKVNDLIRRRKLRR